MCVEGIGDLEVVGYEALQCLATDISGGWKRFGNGDICTTASMGVRSFSW